MNKAFLFDIDGVLTDPVEKKVTDSELLSQIMALLEKDQTVGLNTGRSTEFMSKQIVTPLLEKIQDKRILKSFIAIGEKGGTWIDFDENGQMIHGKDNTIAIPKDILDEGQKLVEEKYSDSMFFDATKETMLSIEMHDGFDLGRFQKRQHELNEDLLQLLQNKGATNKYKIDPTTIATDIESIIVGKAYGADRFLTFVEQLEKSPEEYITFGDSASDFPMADEIDRRGKNVTMVYVGNKEKLGEINKSYKVKFYEGFTKGTLHALKALHT
jgi:hydroxymethylpyrimidine pyrophosphatase-like HAD family hydrolase